MNTIRDRGRELNGTVTPQGSPIGDRSILIVGAGGHAKVLIDLLHASGEFEVVGLVDSTIAPGTLVNGVEVLGPDSPEHLSTLRNRGIPSAANAVGGIGDRSLRSSVWDRLRAAGFRLPALVHPRAHIDRSARLADGAQVLAGAVVGAEASIGADCIINTNAVVSHDCVLGEHVSIAPGALLAGGVHIGPNTLVGMGVSIYLGLHIGADVVIANGTAVFNDIPDGTVVRNR
jgi:sugar O-acyltransferase (sialic acid O-acetyltransferase NeuD family)